MAIDVDLGGGRPWRDRAFGAVVVAGLAVAFATAFIAFAYLEAVQSGDHDVPRARDVVRLECEIGAPGAQQGWLRETPLPFHEAWGAMGAPVEAATRLFAADLSLRVDDRLLRRKVGFVDPEFVQVFGIEAQAGDVTAALTRPDGAVVSRTTARTLFGTPDALGRTFRIGSITYTVLAIVGDRPPSSAIHVDVAVNIRSAAMPREDALTNWLGLTGENYLRLYPGARPDRVAAQAEAFFENTPAYRALPPGFLHGPRKLFTARAVPLPRLPLEGSGAEGRRLLALALTIASLVVVGLAIVNHVNLATIQTLGRQREIGIRKALGASPLHIATSILVESMVTAWAASAVALPLAASIAPAVGEWVGQPLGASLFASRTLAATLLTATLTGLVAGARPAAVALRVHCGRVLAGRADAESSRGLWLRRGMTVLQFSGSIALLGTAGVVLAQVRHATEASPGYDPTPLLAIEAPVTMKDPRVAALREALEGIPGIEAAGISKDVPGRGEYLTSVEARGAGEQAVPIAYEGVGPRFFEAYGIRPIAGRLFDVGRDPQGTKDVVVLNELAVPYLGLGTASAAVGKRIGFGRGTAEVIGVIPSIRHRSLREQPRATAYAIGGRDIAVVTVRASDARAVLPQIEGVWGRYFPDEVFQIEPVRHILARRYDDDRRLARLISAASFVALLLAASGLYAFAAYSARRKSREIVLRKVHGAGPLDIASLLGAEFARVLAAGACVGIPVGAWLAERYLSSFVSRTALVPWALACAVVATAAVGVLAVTRHTIAALRTHPAEVLER